jgi:hypothetical protein
MIWIYLHIDELTYDISRYITAGSFLHISLNPFMSYSMANDPFPRKKKTNKQCWGILRPIYIYISACFITHQVLWTDVWFRLSKNSTSMALPEKMSNSKQMIIFLNSHRIHGAGIYANIWGILMVNVSIYTIHGSYGIVNQKSTTETWIVNSENRSKESKSVYFFSGSITGIAGIINSQDNHQNQDLGSVHEHELLKPTWLIKHGQTSEPQKTNQGIQLKL